MMICVYFTEYISSMDRFLFDMAFDERPWYWADLYCSVLLSSELNEVLLNDEVQRKASWQEKAIE